MLKRLTELYSTVRVLIGMCSRQLLQGRSAYTAPMDMVHMGRFGSVRALRGCVDMLSLLRAPWWQRFFPYLMEVLSGFPLSSRLFLKHLVIRFALQSLNVSLCGFQSIILLQILARPACDRPLRSNGD